MEHKTVAATFKASKTPGEFSAEFSYFGNIDRDGDRMMKGCFEPAFSANPNPAVVWTHLWDIPPIGETLEASETETGAKGVAKLFLDDHETARQVWAGLKTGALKQFSYAMTFGKSGYELVSAKDGESTVRPDGRVREIKALEEIFEWGPTLVGANPMTSVIDLAKSGSRFALAARQKSWNDVDSWEITCLTNMIDYGTSFIVSEQDPEHVANMRSILVDVMALLSTEISEARDAGEDVAVYYDSFRKMLTEGARKAGARNSSDDQARLQTIHDLAMECGAACTPAEADLEDPYLFASADLTGLTDEEKAEFAERFAELKMLDLGELA